MNKQFPYITFNISCGISVIMQDIIDFKNYDGEIEKFFNWIKQYLYKGWDKQFIGYSLYEEAIEPTLYYLEGKVE